MKKILIFLLLSFSIFSWTSKFNRLDFSYAKNPQVQIRVTEIQEIDGKLIFINDNKIDSNEKSQSIKMELYRPLLKVENHSLIIGYGLKIQEPVEFSSKYTDLNYILPLYFSTLYEYGEKSYDYFGKVNIGYNFVFSDSELLEKFDGNNPANMKGGLYFSLESGLIYKNTILSLSYSQSSTKLVVTESDVQNNGKVDLDYTMISLSLGYIFNRK